MRTHAMQLFRVVGAVSIGLAGVGCGGDELECGPGTTEVGGECMGAVGSCGAGTVLVDGKCLPDCEEGEYWNGSKCAELKGCSPGTKESGETCVPACVENTYWNGTACVAVPTCGEGTAFEADAGACVPADTACAEGTHLDQGKCVPDATECGEGTHLDNGKCVEDALAPADVDESADPQGAVSFELPAAGAKLTLGGVVDTPTDLDGDGMVDPDYDHFTFTAKAGTWLRLHATSPGSSHPALVVISKTRDADGAPLYSRYAVDPFHPDAVREVYLPRDDDYVILVSEYDHVVANLYGAAMLPIGGDDFVYRVEVENKGVPTPKALASSSATETGSLAGGVMQFFRLDGLVVHDARQVTHLGVPAGHAFSDVFGALLVFDPKGSLVRQEVAYATSDDAQARFAAQEAGSYLVVVDHLMTTGDRLDFELGVAPVSSTNCSTTDCAAGVLAAGESKLLRWDLVKGDLFAAGVSLPANSALTLDVQLLDAGLVPLAAASSASKYGNGKAIRYASKDERVYLSVVEHARKEVPAYTLDDRVQATTLLTSGTPKTGLTVMTMPSGTYDDAGWARAEISAGRLLVSTGLTVSGPSWTSPVEEYLSPSLDLIGPALDTTSPSFPSSAISPLMAWAPVDGQYLHRVRNGAVADISAETYGTTLHALQPADLGTPKVGTPSALTDRSLHAASGVGVFRFGATKGAKATVKVTPKAGAALQARVWVATPGSRDTDTNKWVSDAGASRVGVVATGAAAAVGSVVTVPVTATYDGVHLVVVRDIPGTAPATDLFDVEVSVTN